MLAYVLTQLLAFGLIAQPVSADEVTCWAPNGKTRADNETYVPCNKLGITQEGVFSSCCQLDGDPDDRDLCTTTGLCLRKGVLSRAYCTDKTWDSPACVNVCTSDEDGGNPNGTVELTSCGQDDTYCCGLNNLECCGTDRAVVIPTQASVVASNVTETAVVTETSTPSTYKNATIGLAVVLGVLALAAAGAIFYLLRQNKSLYAQLNSSPPEPDTAAAAGTHQTPMSQTTHPYQDYVADGSTVTGSPHPTQQEYAQYNKAPMSPSIPEVEGSNRYSELDGGFTHRSDVGSPVQHDGSPYASPMHSPRLDH